MRPLHEVRSGLESTAPNSHNHNNNSPNTPNANGPPVVTRSKASKVLRSGRKSSLPSKPWATPPYSPPKLRNSTSTTNGYAKALKARALNISKSQAQSSAYAKHYKSYRRNSTSAVRRSTPNGVDTPNSNQRSPLKFSSPNAASTAKRRPGPPRRNINQPKTNSSNNNNSDGGSLTGSNSKGGGRRSALWVLNCEAEEFLFGETAADKHELELPPTAPNSNLNSSSSLNSPDSPPAAKKRRRWRETELSHLLETSPILESKLRSPKSLSEKVEKATINGNATNGNCPKAKLNFDQRKKLPNGKIQIPSYTPIPSPFSSPSHYTYGHVHGHYPGDDGRLIIGGHHLNFELHSPRPYIDRAAQLRDTLANVQWNFSFENPPISDCWLAPFSRSTSDGVRSYKSFTFTPAIFSPSISPPCSFAPPPLLLPYQLRKLGPRPGRPRKLSKIKLSRKSPRCHASTLAILSSSEDQPIPQLSPSPIIRRTRNSSAAEPPPPPLKAKPGRKPQVQKEKVPALISRFPQEDLSAQQYLWDSIQFLSDPYVVALLAGDEPPPTTFSNSTETSKPAENSSCRKLTLRSCDGALSSNAVPSPKASPSANLREGTNGLSVNLRRLQPLRSPRLRTQSQSAAVLNPVVVVSDILRINQQGRKLTGKFQSTISTPMHHEFLFSCESLPPLPSWSL